jgi:hypothetical protein
MTEAEFLRHTYRAPSGCLLWVAEGRAHINGQAYGFWWEQTPRGWRPVYAHRWAYIHWKGWIPRGHTLDHRCHSEDESCPGGPSCLHRRCVDPEHLEPVTLAENQARRKGRKAKLREKAVV